MTDLFTGGLPAERKPIRPLWLEDFQDYGDGVPRVPDWRLAEVLDFGRSSNIHYLIETHKPSLERLDTLLSHSAKSTGGRPGTEYLLSFNQAIFIIIKSEAPNAIPVQIHVVEIYGLWAQGKLRPVDAETEAAVEDATAQAFEQSPELMGLLQGLLQRIGELATQTGVKQVGDRIASVQRTALEIQDHLGDIIKRRGAPVRNQDIYDRILIDFYSGRCPCCQRSDRIIIKDDGQRTRGAAGYNLDHATDNPYKNGLNEMWAVCGLCNGKLRADQRYRAEKMDAFRVFQTHIHNHIGQRLV